MALLSGKATHPILVRGPAVADTHQNGWQDDLAEGGGGTRAGYG
jgi:hypothetical protein